MASYSFYLVNNELVSNRITTIAKHCDYTVSSNCFTCTNSSNKIILQMLKDTYFNIITTKKSSLDFTIVAIRSRISKNEQKNEQKNKILNYYYSNLKSDIIKPVLRLKFHIGENIINDSLIFNTVCSFEFLKKILKHFIPDELIQIIYKYINNVELSCIINNYKGDLYISNPSVLIDKSYLKSLLTIK